MCQICPCQSGGANIPAEIHDPRNERLRVLEAVEHLLEPQPLLFADVQPLIAGHEMRGYLLLTFVQERRLCNTVGQEKECDEREGARWETFNEEEDPPRCN